MLSGIGPAHELHKHHIEVVLESCHVGQNLIDHPAVPFVLRVKDGYGLLLVCLLACLFVFAGFGFVCWSGLCCLCSPFPI